MHECNCLETHIPRNSPTLCRQNAAITHSKVCDNSFSIAHGSGNDVGHGDIAELNKL